MICSGVWGCCPANARCPKMRWIDSALLSQLPAKGVKSTITPRAKSQSISSGVWWPVRLSQTSNRRSGGRRAGKVILAGKGDLDREASLPARPLRPMGEGVRVHDGLGQGRQQGAHFGFEPGMQHHVGTRGHAFDAHLARRGTQEGEQLRRAVARIFVRLPGGMADWLPAAARIRHRLKRACFILARQRHPTPLCFAVCLLNQPLFAAASGS
jgi:hypothetical protein